MAERFLLEPSPGRSTSASWDEEFASSYAISAEIEEDQVEDKSPDENRASTSVSKPQSQSINQAFVQLYKQQECQMAKLQGMLERQGQILTENQRTIERQWQIIVEKQKMINDKDYLIQQSRRYIEKQRDVIQTLKQEEYLHKCQEKVNQNKNKEAMKLVTQLCTIMKQEWVEKGSCSDPAI